MPNSKELQKMADQKAEQAKVDQYRDLVALRAEQQKANNSKNK